MSAPRPQDQRTALCDALDAAAADAPTLCEGWTAHHLAAHVWLREHDPAAALGIVVPALAGRTERRLAQLVATRPYAELVADLRRGPPGWSPFRLPGVDRAANTLEFFVHTEDVRRGGGNRTPRELDVALEARTWKQLPALARLALRGCRVAVWLEREVPPGEPLRIGRGPDIVTLLGRPTELVLWLWGRRAAAQVRVFGSAPAISVVERRASGI